MFTTIAGKMNNYAIQQIDRVMQRNHIQQLDHYTQHARLERLKDNHSSDVRIFIAHLLVMSPV